MTCKILLDSTGPYGPKDTIKGKVIYNAPPKGSVASIGCQLVGTENTEFDKIANVDNRNSTQKAVVHYTGNNVFLTIHKLLSTDNNANSDGRCLAPFSLDLPLRIPSTYKNSNGSIQYCIRAFVDEGDGRTSEDEVLIDLKVLINFNYIRSQLQMDPIVFSNEMTTGYFFSNSVTMDMILEKQAYILGENIQLKLHVKNNSSKNISKILLKLIMIIEAKAFNPVMNAKYTERVLAEAEADGLASKREHIYRFGRFRVAESEDIPNLDGSKLFRMKFILKAEALLESSTKSLGVETELHIGHIPFIRVEATRPNQTPRRVSSPSIVDRPVGFHFNNTKSSPSAPMEESRPSAPFHSHDQEDILPPSYDEVMKAALSGNSSKK